MFVDPDSGKIFFANCRLLSEVVSGSIEFSKSIEITVFDILELYLLKSVKHIVGETDRTAQRNLLFKFNSAKMKIRKLFKRP